MSSAPIGGRYRLIYPASNEMMSENFEGSMPSDFKSYGEHITRLLKREGVIDLAVRFNA